MLSNQSKYAIRGVIYLAIHASENKKLSPKEVGKEINIPIPFLAKIFQHLSKEKIQSLLTEKQVNVDTIDDFMSLLKNAELARYTPLSKVEMQHDYDKAAKTISLIDKQMK